MVLPDSSEVDSAVVALLTNDDELAALMPDGVSFDVSLKGASRFVIVSQLAHEETRMFGGTAWEVFTYLVKAVARNSSGASAEGNVRRAAARIHELLEGAVLTVTGYQVMLCKRLERVRFTEVDEDNDARWQHRGGQYELWASPQT